MLLAGLDVSLGTHDDAAAASLIGILDTLGSHDIGTRGEVGTLDPLHEGKAVQFGIVDEGHTGINDLSQVVGGNVGGHTHGNTRGSVDQEVGDAGRHHGGLLEGVIEVVGHIHGVLLQVIHHGLAHEREAGLGVTHGGSTVTIHRTEVTLSIDQRAAHVPLLGHSHQGTVHGTVTVGMILTQYLSDDTGTFLIGFVVGVAQFLHSEKDAAVNGLETVADIGQCSGYDD